jgi:hypothetical protein
MRCEPKCHRYAIGDEGHDPFRLLHRQIETESFIERESYATPRLGLSCEKRNLPSVHNNVVVFKRTDELHLRIEVTHRIPLFASSLEGTTMTDLPKQSVDLRREGTLDRSPAVSQ